MRITAKSKKFKGLKRGKSADYAFNTGIKSLRATLLEEIFTGDFTS
jgi:hypothetical protein